MFVAKYPQTKPRTRTDTLVRHKQRRGDMRFGTWNVRSLYTCGAGSLMDFKEVGCRGMDWFGLAQDRDRWRAVLMR
jgi:hypothetical protein